MYSANLFIDGQSIASSSSDRFEVVNPASEEALGDVPAAGAAEVEASLAAAQRGLVAWRDVRPWDRAALLRRIAALRRDRSEMIALLLTLEVGKPLAEARAEVNVAAEYFDWCADESRRPLGLLADGRMAGSRYCVTHEPVGVVLALTAWNFPISLASRKLAMALAAGCSVILRPAEEAPACVAELVRCCHDAGLPNGAVNLLFGTPEAIIKPLMAASSVRKVSFTGSTRVGQILIRQSAQTVKRLTMELGGHAPFIVLEDADIDKAAAAALTGRLRNAGQVCTSPSRFFVHEARLQAFVDRMADGARATRLGDGRQDGVQMGPLATARQRDRAERLVADARDKGAQIAYGGGRPAQLNRGFFFEPTIITRLSADAAVLTEEPFSPLAAIVPVSGPDEAIARANSLEFGLAAYVFGRSDKSTDYVAARLEAGVIGVNNIAVAVPEMPFGGVKQSGFGREGGPESIKEYLNIKFVHKLSA
jgi:succinate-semialdehyde dehydrogenase / glutarate-semialdehyde dehydrogenase